MGLIDGRVVGDAFKRERIRVCFLPDKGSCVFSVMRTQHLSQRALSRQPVATGVAIGTLQSHFVACIAGSLRCSLLPPLPSLAEPERSGSTSGRANSNRAPIPRREERPFTVGTRSTCSSASGRRLYGTDVGVRWCASLPCGRVAPARVAPAFSPRRVFGRSCSAQQTT